MGSNPRFLMGVQGSDSSEVMDFGFKELSRQRLLLFPNKHFKRKPTLLRLELHKKFE